MALNNSVFLFVRRTSDDSRGRPNLRIDMNQVTNLKSLRLTCKKITNLLGVSTSFLSPYFCNRPLCGRRCCRTRIFISCCRSRWFTCTNTIKLSAFTSTPSTSLYSRTVFLTYLEKMVAGFHPSTLLLCSPNL